MNSLVAIIGPTATGKSQLAIELAQNFNAEIVGADSRQVYRYMDIGTAKPSQGEMSLVPHHLIDIINPDEDFSLALYQQLANQAIGDIQKRGKLPLLVGGSGLYVRAVLEGWGIPKVAPNSEYRARLEERAERGEADTLYNELATNDPEAAQSIDRRNIRRVIRALEVSHLSSFPFSRQREKRGPSQNTLMIGLTTDRQALYLRIDSRVDMMIEGGLIDEVKKLFNMGYGADLPSMSGIGYRQIGNYLNGKSNLDSAVYRMKTETHRLVRQQYNWFKLEDKRINWFDIKEDIFQKISAVIANHLAAD